MAYVLAIFWFVYLFRLYRGAGVGRVDPEKAERRVLIYLALTCLLVFFRTMFPIRGLADIFPIDDSYITLTAARNLAEYNLFAVNPQAPLAGITSPLHVAVVGTLGKLMPVPTASRLIGLLAFLALVWAVFEWSKKLGASLPTAAGAAAVVAVSGQMAAHALNGLETVLFSALVLWAFAAWEMADEKPKFFYLLGLLTGLAILARPEGWFLAAALYVTAGVNTLRQRRNPIHLVLSGLLALLIVAPYLLANYLTLDALFPLTVSAKKFFFADMCKPWVKRLEYTVRAATPLLGTYLFVFPLLFWSRSFLRRAYPLLFLFIFYFAYFMEFPGALFHYGGRYQHPLVPMLLVGLVLGGEGLVRWLRRFPQRIPQVAALGLLLFFALNTGFNGHVHRQSYRNTIHQTKEYLVPTAMWVKDHSAPGDLVATHDIGAVYYFSERKVLDLVGLTDPVVAQIHADIADPCGDRTAQKLALYILVEGRRPKVISVMRKWDDIYLGLLRHDRGRHLHEAGHLNIRGAGITYFFYLCDWSDSPAEQKT